MDSPRTSLKRDYVSTAVFSILFAVRHHARSHLAAAAGRVGRVVKALSPSPRRRQPPVEALFPLAAGNSFHEAAAAAAPATAMSPALSVAMRHSLPDFTLRGAASYLESTSFARLIGADNASNKALALPGFISEVARCRRFKGVQNLAQLHLAEAMATASNVLDFGFMSGTLHPRGRSVLEHVGKLLCLHPAADARVEAHSQPGAPPAIAVALSRARAAAAMGELQRCGVASSRLCAFAFSNDCPLRDCRDEGAHRRVEVFISLDGAQFPAERLPVEGSPSVRVASVVSPAGVSQGFRHVADEASNDTSSNTSSAASNDEDSPPRPRRDHGRGERGGGL